MAIVPYEAKIIVPLRERDNQFIQLQDLIDAKKKLLLDKQKKLRFISTWSLQYVGVIESICRQ